MIIGDVMKMVDIHEKIQLFPMPYIQYDASQILIDQRRIDLPSLWTRVIL